LLQLIRSNHLYGNRRAANWTKHAPVSSESLMTFPPDENPVPENEMPGRDIAHAVAQMREPPGRLGHIVRQLKRGVPAPGLPMPSLNRAQTPRE
jgi:hypothetical protein